MSYIQLTNFYPTQQELYGFSDEDYKLVLCRPAKRWENEIPLTLDGLRGGVHLMGGPGSGKSFFLGRVKCPFFFKRGIPTFVLEPPGAATMQHFLAVFELLLGKWCRKYGLNKEQVAALRDRVMIIDVSAQLFGRVISFPALKKLYPDESWSAVADRLIQLFLDLSPQLLDAPVRGEASLTRTARQIFIAFAALYLTLIDVHRFLYAPEEYRTQIEALRDRADGWEVRAACDYLLDDFIKQARKRKTWEIDQLTGAVAAKLPLFFSDDATVAFFNGEHCLDFEKCERDKRMVFFDFSNVKNETMLQLTMNWVNRWLGAHFLHRGSAGHHKPIAYVVDELASLYKFSDASGGQRFARALDHQIQVLGRNYGIINVLAHQSQQFDIMSFNALMEMGTQVIGNIQNFEVAIDVIKRLGKRVDPLKVKHINYSFLSFSSNANSWLPTFHIPVENGAEYYSLDEQWVEQAYKLMDLPPLNFLGRFPQSEGDRTAPTEDFDVSQYYPGVWPDQKRKYRWQRLSMEREGAGVKEVIARLRDGKSSPVEPRIPTDDTLTEEADNQPIPATDKPLIETREILAAFDAAFEDVKQAPPASKYLSNRERKT